MVQPGFTSVMVEPEALGIASDVVHGPGLCSDTESESASPLPVRTCPSQQASVCAVESIESSQAEHVALDCQQSLGVRVDVELGSSSALPEGAVVSASDVICCGCKCS